jgi:uncharacterized protein (DUF1778 family)
MSDKKTEIIRIRCTRKQKNILKGKARIYKKTLSQFILEELLGPHVSKKKGTKISSGPL